MAFYWHISDFEVSERKGKNSHLFTFTIVYITSSIYCTPMEDQSVGLMWILNNNMIFRMIKADRKDIGIPPLLAAYPGTVHTMQTTHRTGH